MHRYDQYVAVSRGSNMGVIKESLLGGRALSWITGAMVVSLLSTAPVAVAEVSLPASEPPALGGPSCPWPELSGHTLLDHQLGGVTFANVPIRDAVQTLVRTHGMPLSFIESSPGGRVTVALPNCTLKQLLDKIVASVPGYRYDFIGSHLVLYSSDPTWRTRIEHLDLPAGPRIGAIDGLVQRLGRLVPTLARLVTPGVRGHPDSIVYMDPVQLAAPATVVELFTQLLGQRTSAVFTVSNFGRASPSLLQVTIVGLLKSLDVTSPRTALRQIGESVQLQVTGVLRDGAHQDLTSSSCGTRYFSTSDTFRVSRDGLATSASAGQGAIVVGYDNLGKSIFIDVVPPGASRGAAGGSR
jgi:hypothetical protein